MGSNNKYDGLDAYAISIIRRKASQLVRRRGFVEADREDLEQDLLADLERRLPQYDPTKAKRTTFIVRVIEHRVATIIESRKAGLRDYRREAGSLDERRLHRGVAADEPPVLTHESYRQKLRAAARQDEERLSLQLDLTRVIGTLPPEQRALCRRLVTSTVSEVSRETGVPRSTLYGSVHKIRKCFERAGIAAYLAGAKRPHEAPTHLTSRR